MNRHLMAELTLDKTMLHGRADTETITPSRRPPVVSYLHDTHRLSEWRACRVVRIPVSNLPL